MITTTKTHSVTFRRDVTISTYLSMRNNVLVRDMTYKKFFALNLSEFTFTLDHSDTDVGKAKTIAKLERAGYTITNMDDAMYKFEAIKVYLCH